VWLIGAVMCLLAANRGSSCALMRALNGHIVRCGIISLCQSNAISQIVKQVLLVKFDSCTERYSKYWTFIVIFICIGFVSHSTVSLQKH